MTLAHAHQIAYTPQSRCFGVEVIMLGGIYSQQHCHCGRVLVHDERRRGCYCPDHPDVRANRFIVRFPGGILQRHKSYEAATQSLNYLRHEKGTRRSRFNPDDYRSIRPNSFNALKDKYLARKKDLRSYGKTEYSINLASLKFGLINVREITGADIEDYLFSIENISEKTRYDHCCYLRNFWKWCLGRGNVITLAEMPTFPTIPYELGYRKITTWETQTEVLNKLREIAPERTWLACDMLATYTALRPEDIRRMKESSLEGGWITLMRPTKLKNKAKHIHLHPDHETAWRSLQSRFPGMPDMPFFRDARTGKVFGKNHLYKWWARACELVGLKGVPLYPGTKHTTATETAKMLGADKAREASGLTNKAFDRYCQTQGDGAFEVVTAIRRKRADVVPLKRKAEEG